MKENFYFFFHFFSFRLEKRHFKPQKQQIKKKIKFQKKIRNHKITTQYQGT